MNMLTYIIILLLTLGTTLTILIVSIRRPTTSGLISLIVFALSIIIWITAYTLLLTGVPPTGFFWLGFTKLCGTITTTAFFTFALEYTNRRHLLTWFSISLLAVEPAFTQILLWTDRLHSQYSTGYAMDAIETIRAGSLWFWIDAIYSNSLVLIAIFLFIQTFIRKSGQYRLQSVTILAGAFILILIKMINLVGLTIIYNYDLTPIAFSIAGLFFTYGLFHHYQLEFSTVGRDIVVEKMKDGWIILDMQNRIVDLNPAAEALIGLSRNMIYGQSAEKILSDWQNVIKRDGNIKELVINKSVKNRDGWRYLNIGSSPLTDQSGHYIGQVLVLRDITEHRKADEARRQSYDKLLSQLRAISNAASQTLNLRDFLAASIHQLVYSFHSQSGVIFLLDEHGNESGMRGLAMTAHHGLTAQAIDSMSSLQSSNNLVAWILEHKEPQLIPDLSSALRVPEFMKQLGHATLLSVPILTEDQVLGVICLLRKEESAYRRDEIINMTIISEEIATFIQGDRQRQSVIALAERQRLVRDLHDSISHNLYGVVALTEAAQAGLEARSIESQAEVLSRIGETARLAVKEMRLFLHELQPADLVHEGLVPALHQRLEAVEGRSNVKALLITNYNGSLPLRKEVMLYYITQEALNNVLRHSHAKSVTIRLKQTKGNIILEIEDFGCGFDPTQVSNEGMGLRNMRERASLAGGKFEVISTPGKGTKVIVTIEGWELNKENLIARG